MDLPRVIKFGFNNFAKTDNGTTTQCKFCTGKKTVMSEKLGTTSNYVKHLQRVHSTRWVLSIRQL